MTNRVVISTYKDGLLARLAHDLQIRCRSFTVVRRGEQLEARFMLASLQVDGAVERGAVAPGVLSDGDRRKIEQTMAQDVLEVRRFPEATLAGTIRRSGANVTIDAALTLHGQTVTLAPLAVQRRDAHWVVETTLTQTRWGIAPYRALAGALKLQDRVAIRVELTADRGDDGDATWSP
jgi:hypothetical protein